MKGNSGRQQYSFSGVVVEIYMENETISHQVFCRKHYVYITYTLRIILCYSYSGAFVLSGILDQSFSTLVSSCSSTYFASFIFFWKIGKKHTA